MIIRKEMFLFRGTIVFVLFFSFVFVCYTTFFSYGFRRSSSSCPVSSEGGLTPTDISHLFFGIGASESTWNTRRGYTESWWRQDSTRGYVWLDQAPHKWPVTSPPYRVSEGPSYFVRIARIVVESYKLVVTKSTEEVRWFVMGDDDTVFFTENLVSVLGKYDHREMYYVGSYSETVVQATAHSYGMAYGGGGIAVSLAAAAALSKSFDECLARYESLYGGDGRVKACLTELGVPLTLEPGFHQMDIRGDPYGMLAAHPVAPLVSLHHLDCVDVIFPDTKNQQDAVRRLTAVSNTDQSRTLQQTICYEPSQNWSVSVSWGYTVQIYPFVLSPKQLVTPLQTFQAWSGSANGPFTFDTSPLSSDPCERPMVYFLDRVGRTNVKGTSSTTEYRKKVKWKVDEIVCNREEYDVVSRIETVEVIAPKMDPNDWKRAPRRHCCQATRRWLGKAIEVRIRKCNGGESGVGDVGEEG